MLRINRTIAVLLLAVTSSALKAQETFTVADNSSSGTYAKMLGEIVSVCSTDGFNIVEARGVTGGAPGNLDALVNNKAQAALLHSDVFLATAQADPGYMKYQTLVALYPEPIHVLALRQSKTPKAGRFTMGKQDFTTLSDLKGFKVGAAGGGTYTARVLQSAAGFEPVQYNSGDEVIQALNSGEIAAAIFVGAAPLPNLEKLNKSQYKLLPIGNELAEHFKETYRPATINYAGLTNGPVRTIAPVATLITRKYSTEAKISAQRHFRNCFYEHLDQLKDEGSPNWQSVTVGDHGVLPNNWYEIPGSTTTTSKKR